MRFRPGQRVVCVAERFDDLGFAGFVRGRFRTNPRHGQTYVVVVSEGIDTRNINGREWIQLAGFAADRFFTADSFRACEEGTIDVLLAVAQHPLAAIEREERILRGQI